MNIVKYLQKAGYDTLDNGFYTLIDIWESWYQANVKKFHRYRVYNGNKYTACRRLSLGMAKKVSEDIADLLLNEKVPLSWSNGHVSECAFVFYKTISTKKYAQIQIHKLESGQYVIENHVVECTNGTGKEIYPEDWASLKGLENLAPKIQTGSTERQFVIDRLNIVNNYGKDNPMGVSIFANAIDVLQGTDIAYDSYINEFVLGKKRIFTAPEMLRTDLLGNPIFDPNDIVFYQLPEGTLEKTGGKPIVEVNMEIRAEEHEKAINDNLNILSMKCGFGQNHYKFENGSIQTATQVISENSDMYRTISKHEILLEPVLEELIRIIIRLGNVLNTGLDPNTKIVIDFDDSIIEDKQAERQSDRQDVSMGAMSLVEYRAKWYGETEEDAAKRIVQEISDPDPEEE